MREASSQPLSGELIRVVSTWIKAFLGLPGIHFLLTRFGNSRLRAASFDEKFNRGDWNFTLDRSAELVSIVEQHAHQGHILMLGCGSASLAGVLAPDSFAGFMGVDISPEAIRRASSGENHKVRFTVADFTAYRCPRAYNVILFSESIYYVGPFRRKALLKKLATNLVPGGVIVVTIAEPQRYAGILRLIRNNFTLIEDRLFHTGERHLIVFR